MLARIGDPARTSDPGQAKSIVIYGADGLGGANWRQLAPTNAAVLGAGNLRVSARKRRPAAARRGAPGELQK